MAELRPEAAHPAALPQRLGHYGAGAVCWRLSTSTIERQRILQGMTREALAHTARVDPKTVRDALNGRRRPTLGTVQQLASAVGLELADVLVFEVEAVARRRPAQSPSPAPNEQLRLGT